jgi:hypothetical protein
MIEQLILLPAVQARSVDPMLVDLASRECVIVKCRCGRIAQLPPYQLIGRFFLGLFLRSGLLNRDEYGQNRMAASTVTAPAHGFPQGKEDRCADKARRQANRRMQGCFVISQPYGIGALKFDFLAEATRGARLGFRQGESQNRSSRPPSPTAPIRPCRARKG